MWREAPRARAWTEYYDQFFGASTGSFGPDTPSSIEWGRRIVVRLHRSVIWPAHGTGLISDRCAGFCSRWEE